MKKYFSLLAIVTVVTGFMVADPAFAQMGFPFFGNRGEGNQMHMQLGIIGTVSAINGTTISVNQVRTNTVYTVNATNATVEKNNAVSSLSAISVGDNVIVQGTVSGNSVTATKIWDGVKQGWFNEGGKVISGSVTAVNGNTITITSKKGEGENNSAGASYTVDATNSTVTKNGQASSVSNIAVGDMIMVKGTISGSNVTATSINDVVKAAPVITGNGQPVVAGTVTTISGTIITITNKSNVVYTVDASNAKVEKGGQASSVSNIAVGDNVVIQGTVNGTSITASSVIDQTRPVNNQGNGIPQPKPKFFDNILNGFKNFFKIFGF